MKKVFFGAVTCMMLLSCNLGLSRAEEEIKCLQEKLDNIKSMADEASYTLSTFIEDNSYLEDSIDIFILDEDVFALIECIQEECAYDDYDFYI